MRDGKIVFQGGSENGGKQGAWDKPGAVKLACAFTVPQDARGTTFSLYGGLWQPERLGKPDERLVPDSGQTERSVLLGILSVSADGEATFSKAAAP
jgi:hypothetical protein